MIKSKRCEIQINFLNIFTNCIPVIWIRTSSKYMKFKNSLIGSWFRLDRCGKSSPFFWCRRCWTLPKSDIGTIFFSGPLLIFAFGRESLQRLDLVSRLGWRHQLRSLVEAVWLLQWQQALQEILIAIRCVVLQKLKTNQGGTLWRTWNEGQHNTPLIE